MVQTPLVQQAARHPSGAGGSAALVLHRLSQILRSTHTQPAPYWSCCCLVSCRAQRVSVRRIECRGQPQLLLPTQGAADSSAAARRGGDGCSAAHSLRQRTLREKYQSLDNVSMGRAAGTSCDLQIKQPCRSLCGPNALPLPHAESNSGRRMTGRERFVRSGRQARAAWNCKPKAAAVPSQ